MAAGEPNWKQDANRQQEAWASLFVDDAASVVKQAVGRSTQSINDAGSVVYDSDIANDYRRKPSLRMPSGGMSRVILTGPADVTSIVMSAVKPGRNNHC